MRPTFAKHAQEEWGKKWMNKSYLAVFFTINIIWNNFSVGNIFMSLFLRIQKNRYKIGITGN